MKAQKSPSFLNYIMGRIDFYKQLGNEQRADRYYRAFEKLRKFTQGKDITFAELTRDRMEMLEAWMKQEGNCMNTISYYNRILRTLYNYTRGMSWIDLVTLKKTDIQQGVIVYRRHKTNQKLYIKIEKPMKQIFEKYWDDDSDYLLNIIKSKDDKGARRESKNALLRINNALHELGKIIGVQNLTMYVARHSWASACKSSNIPISVISEGMGHDSEETTRIYLAQLDTSVVDKANRKIINQII